MLDHAQKIYHLTLVIKSLCEEFNLNKQVVIEDFIGEIMKKNKENNGTS